MRCDGRRGSGITIYEAQRRLGRSLEGGGNADDGEPPAVERFAAAQSPMRSRKRLPAGVALRVRALDQQRIRQTRRYMFVGKNLRSRQKFAETPSGLREVRFAQLQ